MNGVIRLVREERGQAMVLVAIFLMGLVGVAGLVADGGLVLAQRRDLQNVADAAAAAGAMQVDEAAYRASGGAIVSLDAAAARATAIDYLTRENNLEYTVDAGAARVEVDVSRQAGTAFLKMLGIANVDISARSVAEPRSGVTGGP